MAILPQPGAVPERRNLRPATVSKPRRTADEATAPVGVAASSTANSDVAAVLASLS